MESLNDTLKLIDGHTIPRLGLGTFQLNPEQIVVNALTAALEIGYRHIDTAEMYKNEKAIGDALENSSIDRQELFITSKVWPSHFDYDQTIKVCHDSLKRLGTDYLDLYLLHWPGQGDMQAWKALIQLQKDNVCRSIGVSNFNQAQIETLISETGVVPAVNQIEFSPFNYKKTMLEYCHGWNIRLEAYAPLTRGKRMDDPVVQEIAGHHNKSAAQALIRWVLQHNMIVIPKSAHPERIEENANVFDFALTPEEMERLDALDEGYSAL